MVFVMPACVAQALAAAGMILAPCRTIQAQAKMNAKNLMTRYSAPRVYTHGYKNVAPTELKAMFRFLPSPKVRAKSPSRCNSISMRKCPFFHG